MRDSMTENPMAIDSLWNKPKPRYRKIYNEEYDEVYIVDEQGREVDPALLREKEDEE